MTLFEIPGGAEINNGLVAYYPLNDKRAGSGVTVAKDLKGFNDGVYNGCVKVEGIDGLNPYATGFDGVDDNVGINDLILGTRNHSFSFLVKTTAASGERGLVGNSSTNTNKFILINASGRITVEGDINNDSAMASDSVLVDGNYHSLVISLGVGANSAQFYLDGIPMTMTDNNMTDTTFTINLIGRSGVGSTIESFDGSIQNFRAYKRVLTQADALKITRGRL